MIDKIQAQHNKNYCNVWINNIMPSKFAETLAKILGQNKISPSELARKAKTSRANISRLVNDAPHPVSGALPKPSEEMVDRLEKALNINNSELRLAAGFAPRNIGESKEILDGATVNFDETKFTKSQREKMVEAMEIAGVPEYAKKNIVGHSTGETHQIYHRISANVLDDARESIDAFRAKIERTLQD